MRLALTSCIALAAAVVKVSAGCWAQSQGYQCCNNPGSTKVEYTDASGNWGVQNGEWCGIDYSYQNNATGNQGCTGNGAYPCCNSCNTVYTDSDGNWGIENNEWCGIKNSCSSQQQQRTTTTRTTTQQSQPTSGGSSNGNVPVNPPDFSGQTGKTTRYWDCCLASCSWQENTKDAGAKGVVRSCKIDGMTSFTDLSNLWQVKSGCNGGSVYMCNDQQPWAINENVAYGFVASHEKCCTCQRLKFTSGPVAGKQMIVQTTNTGGDLSQNHFDIQMPGGGIGIFDGCTSQFGGSHNWGERYGGIKSASECANLPGVLKQGCEWRFNWFKNADNPSVVFERVQCPKELTDITGCVPGDDASAKKLPW